MCTPKERPRRRTLFTVVPTVAGVVLLALELARPAGPATGERWFWLAVGVLLITLGIAELRSRRGTRG